MGRGLGFRAACVLSTLALAGVLAAPGQAAPQFSDIGAALPGLSFSSAAWGDDDNDGDLDLLLTGSSALGAVSMVFRNDAGSFVDIGAPLTGVYGGAAAWGDYDGDGRLDILLAGTSGSGAVAKVYHNDGGGVFTDILADLPGFMACALAWGDYDNDGDLDFVISGTIPAAATRIYRNDGGGVFREASVVLPGVYSGSVAWGDYDNDGDLDLLLTGNNIACVYRNDGGAFTDIGAPLQAVSQSSAAWGDYDNDGDLDIAIAGYTSGGARVARVYRNDGGGTFTDIGVTLHGVSRGVVAWGDFDNDGDLDLFLAGDYFGYIAEVYRNDGGGTFTDIAAGLPGLLDGSVAWGDYDNDGDLDLVLTGATISSGRIAEVYRNNSSTANGAPSRPAGLRATSSPFGVTLRWSAASDGQTPARGLSYNLRVGTTPGAQDVVSPMADLGTGRRRVPALGNAGPGTSALLLGLARNTTYYWSVQAVDTAFAGSAFGFEGRFFTSFTDIGAALPVLSNGEAAWGDYDNDGDLDLAIAGEGELMNIGRIYRNDGGGTFTDIGAPLPQMSRSALAWGDYDNDGDLDLVIAGESAFPTVILTRLMRNDGGGVFTDTGEALLGLEEGSAAWGDYDNDGDLDLLLTGHPTGPSSVTATRLYRNLGPGMGVFFVSVDTALPGVSNGSAEWGDYDGDGDLDVLIAGWDGAQPIARIYRNDGIGRFTDIHAGLPGVSSSAAAWGDYDNDGDLDLALVGSGQTARVAKIFRNDSTNRFTDIGAGLTPASGGSVAWGDADDDGDLDLLITGQAEGFGLVAAIYRNDGAGVFTDTHAALTGVQSGSAAWGDYDDDGDLDLVLIGSALNFRVASVYRNDAEAPNGRPSAPTSLSVSVAGTSAVLAWQASVDAHTPSAGLSYNVRVGTAPGAENVACSMAAPSGWRRLPAAGNAQHGTTALLRGLTPGATYYWSVQAIDPGFVGSHFSAQGSFVDTTPAGRPSILADAVLVAALMLAALALRRSQEISRPHPRPFSRQREKGELRRWWRPMDARRSGRASAHASPVRPRVHERKQVPEGSMDRSEGGSRPAEGIGFRPDLRPALGSSEPTFSDASGPESVRCFSLTRTW
jgi:VCBS repeat protein